MGQERVEKDGKSMSPFCTVQSVSTRIGFWWDISVAVRIQGDRVNEHLICLYQQPL